MAGMPLSVTSTSSADPSAMFGGGAFEASPSYAKPPFDLSNPVHVAVIVGAVAAYFWLKKRFK